MVVLVCGSRAWDDVEIMRGRLALLPRGTQIISGGARGADQMAATIGRSLGFEVTEYPANWRPDGSYNARAGLERNIRMLEQKPDLVVAFWTGGSTGTKHTIDNANKRGIPVEIVEMAQ